MTVIKTSSHSSSRYDTKPFCQGNLKFLLSTTGYGKNLTYTLISGERRKMAESRQLIHKVSKELGIFLTTYPQPEAAFSTG